MKRFILSFLMIFVMVFLPGCTQKNEIATLAVVVALGFDAAPDGKRIVSMQILNQQKQSSGGMGGSKGGGKEGPSDILTVIVSGDTIPDALANISKELGKKPHLAHAKYMVIGEGLAKSGVKEIVDYGFREHELRTNIPILVTKGKASDVIKAAAPYETIPAKAVVDILNEQERYGFTPVIANLEFANALSNKTTAPVAGLIELYSAEHSGGTFKIAGTAVFQKDKLIGYLDEEETRGMQWIKGEVGAGMVVIPSLDQGRITLMITKASSKIKPAFKDNVPVIEVTINEKGFIREIADNIDPMKEPEIVRELEQRQNEAIKKEVEKALYAAQKKLKADIFGFGEAMHREYPGTWKNMEDDWGVIFSDLNVEVTVSSNIQRTGLISKPFF